MTHHSKKDEIIKYSFFYTLSHYTAQVLNFFTAVLMRRFLGPVYMGIWGLLKVLIGYAAFADLGSQTAISYKIPFLKGKGDAKKADEAIKSVFNFTTIATAVISLGVLLYAVALRQRLSFEVFVGLGVVAVLLIVQRIYTYYIVLLRANKDFDILSRSLIFDAIANILFILIVVRTFKLYGLFLIVLILPVLNVWYIRRYKDYGIRFTRRMPDIIGHIKFGFPIFLSNIVKYILQSTDTIMIAAILGIRQVGYYTLALMSKGYSEDISKTLSHIIIPYMFEDYGRSEDVRKVSKYVTSLTLISSYFMAILLSLAFILAQPFVIYILPKFIPGIMAMKIFFLASFFTGITIYAFNYLIALNKQMRVLPVIIAVICLNVGLDYLFIKKGFGIEGVAFASAVSAFLFFCFTLSYAMKHFADINEIISFFVKILFPLLYCAVILSNVNYFFHLDNIILESFIKSVVFIVIILPILYILNRETEIFNLIWKLLFKKMANTRT